MAQKDKIKWDSKYREMADLLASRPPSDMVKKHYAEAPGKRALDLACGSGRHSIFLSGKGFRVDAVDISSVALEHTAAKVDGDNITIIEADLDRYSPAPETYDLIIETNYLDRSLIERAKDTLKEGGVFIVETYVSDEANEKKDSNPDYLLRKNELLSIFGDGFEVLEHKSFWNETYEKYRMKKEAIAVRKNSE